MTYAFNQNQASGKNQIPQAVHRFYSRFSWGQPGVVSPWTILSLPTPTTPILNVPETRLGELWWMGGRKKECSHRARPFAGLSSGVFWSLVSLNRDFCHALHEAWWEVPWVSVCTLAKPRSPSLGIPPSTKAFTHCLRFCSRVSSLRYSLLGTFTLYTVFYFIINRPCKITIIMSDRKANWWSELMYPDPTPRAAGTKSNIPSFDFNIYVPNHYTWFHFPNADRTFWTQLNMLRIVGNLPQACLHNLKHVTQPHWSGAVREILAGP